MNKMRIRLTYLPSNLKIYSRHKVFSASLLFRYIPKNVRDEDIDKNDFSIKFLNNSLKTISLTNELLYIKLIQLNSNKIYADSNVLFNCSLT